MTPRTTSPSRAGSKGGCATSKAPPMSSSSKSSMRRNSLFVDRTRALELGLNEAQIANNVNVSLSSSFQVAPNFWTDPRNGIPYPLVVQTPEYAVSKMADLENTPLLGGSHPDQAGTTNLLTERRNPEARHPAVEPGSDSGEL